MRAMKKGRIKKSIRRKKDLIQDRGKDRGEEAQGGN